MTPPWPHTGPNGGSGFDQLDRYTLRLLTRQAGLCPFCGEPLLTADQPPPNPPSRWERWWLQVTRRAIAASYLESHHGKPAPPDGDPDPPGARILPARAPSPPAQEPSTSACDILAACLSRVRGPTRTHGSEGSGARQRVPLTRRCPRLRGCGRSVSISRPPGHCRARKDRQRLTAARQELAAVVPIG